MILAWHGSAWKWKIIKQSAPKKPLRLFNLTRAFEIANASESCLQLCTKWVKGNVYTVFVRSFVWYTNKNNDDNKAREERIKARMDMNYNGMVFDKLFAPFVRQWRQVYQMKCKQDGAAQLWLQSTARSRTKTHLYGCMLKLNGRSHKKGIISIKRTRANSEQLVDVTTSKRVGVFCKKKIRNYCEKLFISTAHFPHLESSWHLCDRRTIDQRSFMDEFGNTWCIRSPILTNG